jgi:soluble lytic murein transglycosylase
MASMVSRLTRIGLLASPLVLLAPAMCVAQELSSDQLSYYQGRLGVPGNIGANPGRPNEVAEAVLEWQSLVRTPGSDFDRLARFLVRHRGWPNETDLRTAAERALVPGAYIPASAVEYFAVQPPTNAAGHLRHALALNAAGRREDALTAARLAWTSGALSVEDEAQFFTNFGASMTNAEHDRRMERLLWSGETTAAGRQLNFVSSARRSEFDARFAMRARLPDAAQRAAQAEAIDRALTRSNAGYIADKATWLRASGQVGAARTLLAATRTLAQPPLDAEEWYETLLTNARGAADAGDFRLAYAIARQVDDGLPAGTIVIDQPIGVRDDYTSLVWLAATTANDQLNEHRDAIRLFDLYSVGGRSPQVRSKGLYWAGRAALSAGDNAAATDHFTRAGLHYDQFYGQLALERLGQPQPRPAPPTTVTFSQAEREAFDNNSLVRAIRVLGEIGAHRDQTLFLRAISNNARSEASHYFAAQLAQQINRPDLGVMIGRSARINGLYDYVPTAFPVLRVPSGTESNWTFIHAITRQESQFDRAAISRAGARGMMQLMPGTAREQANRLGLGYSADRLLTDPDYNIMLGSDYFQRMLSYFGGSYPLAIAAYNAGPGNVNRWLAANGDPRTGSVDMLRWIERIPLTETRGYVQRVLENAVVYETLNPANNGTPPRNLLSRYLGRSTPG